MTTASASDTSASSGKPLRADAERNRLRIISAARGLFAERGLDVSLDDVAEAAGVGVGTVYRRFANRDDLVFGVFLEHLKSVVARTGEAIDDEDPWNAVVGLMTWMCQVMSEDRGLAAIIMTIDHSNPEIEALKATLSERIEKIFDRAMAAGVLRPDLTPTDFYALFTMLKAVSEVTEQCAPGTWRRYLDLILDAVSAEPSRTTLGAPPMTPEQIREMQKAHKAGR
ncbi:putative TetR family transcriptional regulator [Gordonia polyisoprenivorans NBRC 16320 = JCM 10675]|uniref:TetR/AcrR family transcriptional regulator n=1 Tax=Gordonia polyisoprenivorans TaxID=84595 RepID=A0A846WQW5_9ACTN|nr:TetR/AcrR family transcriptional regulator [Gordonia polyisoprenivorans]MBE7195970.1 TetR/AcrR family transcriptional regulator [Gordonia polyisoprenivorans]NKY03889.1 TetR/AcrR family transcriptional regulator [Gordonia polyisoprenivorans]GAB24200.1 putative TetR family transcriptional regulator [Gordonia polyisoprenivorans NBRC 16320 = JCM 10675]